MAFLEAPSAFDWQLLFPVTGKITLFLSVKSEGKNGLVWDWFGFSWARTFYNVAQPDLEIKMQSKLDSNSQQVLLS